jgi:RNA polymerase sigma factor (sigma-70 family)
VFRARNELALNGARRWIGRRERDALGDPDAEYEWFYRAEYAMVARSVFLILHDRQRAEDIAQDAFIQLYTHWRKVSRYDRPDAWVRRVAIRMAIRHLKRESTRPSLEGGADPSIAPSPIDLDLVEAIRQLTAIQRAVVVLFYFEDRPVAEIADVLGTSEGAVKMALQRARRSIGERLNEGVGDDANRP